MPKGHKEGALPEPTVCFTPLLGGPCVGQLSRHTRTADVVHERPGEAGDVSDGVLVCRQPLAPLQLVLHHPARSSSSSGGGGSSTWLARLRGQVPAAAEVSAEGGHPPMAGMRPLGQMRRYQSLFCSPLPRFILCTGPREHSKMRSIGCWRSAWWVGGCWSLGVPPTHRCKGALAPPV